MDRTAGIAARTDSAPVEKAAAAGRSGPRLASLLLVAGETRIADFLRRGLIGEGWIVTVARDGATALRLAVDNDFDVVVVSARLPDMSGPEVCRGLRAAGDHPPSLILPGVNGVDTLPAKAFDLDRLVARIGDVVRRTRAARDGRPRASGLAVGRLTFDHRSLDVRCCDRTVRLTPKERDVLRLLLSAPGTVFSRERILNVVWNVSEDPLTNVVDVFVSRLRKKLGPCGRLIATVRGAGYRISADG